MPNIIETNPPIFPRIPGGKDPITILLEILFGRH